MSSARRKGNGAVLESGAGSTAASEVAKNPGDVSLHEHPQDSDLIKAVAMIELEALVEQYADLKAKIASAYRKLDLIRYRINQTAHDSGIKLPFHCAAGTIRNSYANERYGKPRKYVLRSQKNGLVRSRRLVVKPVAA